MAQLFGEFTPAQKLPESDSDGNIIKDTGIDLARGVVGLGQMGTGLANLASGGASGRALRDTFGGDLEDVSAKLGDYYSSKRKASDEEVGSAKGFLDTAAAVATHPRSAFGGLMESVPSMLMPAGIAGKVGKVFLEEGMVAAKAAGLVGKEAEAYAVKSAEAAGMKGATNAATSASWGAISGGQAADQFQHDHPDNVGGMYTAGLGTGLTTGAITHGFSLLPGGGAAQAFGGVAGNEVAGGVGRRVATSVANQSGMMGSMAGAQTAATNLGAGKDIMEGMGASVAGGMVNGAGFGLAHGLMHGKAPERTGSPEGDVLSQDKPLEIQPPAEPPPAPPAPPAEPPGQPAPPSPLQPLAPPANIIDPAAHAALAPPEPIKTPGKPEPVPVSEAERAAVFAKYGEGTPVENPQTGATDGMHWQDTHHYTQDEYHAAVDAIAVKERVKSETQHAAETALGTAMRDNDMPTTPASVGGGEYKKLLAGATDTKTIAGRINTALDGIDAIVKKATATLEKTQKRVDDADPAKGGNGMIGPEVLKSPQAAVDKIVAKQKLYNSWLDNLAKLTGEDYGDRTTKSIDPQGITTKGPESVVQPAKDAISHGSTTSTEGSGQPQNQGPQQVRVSAEPKEKPLLGLQQAAAPAVPRKWWDGMPTEYALRIERASIIDRQRIRMALGLDNEGHQSVRPKSHAEIGALQGVTKEAITHALNKLGFGAPTVDRLLQFEPGEHATGRIEELVHNPADEVKEDYDPEKSNKEAAVAAVTEDGPTIPEEEKGNGKQWADETRDSSEQEMESEASHARDHGVSIISSVNKSSLHAPLTDHARQLDRKAKEEMNPSTAGMTDDEIKEVHAIRNAKDTETRSPEAEAREARLKKARDDAAQHDIDTAIDKAKESPNWDESQVIYNRFRDKGHARWESLTELQQAEWVARYDLNEHLRQRGRSDDMEAQYNEFRKAIENEKPTSVSTPVHEDGAAGGRQSEDGEALSSGGTEVRSADASPTSGADKPAPVVTTAKRSRTVTKPDTIDTSAKPVTGERGKLGVKKDAPVADASPESTKPAVYREAPEGTLGTDRDKVQGVVDRITKGWENAPKIDVVQSISDLPQHLQDQIKKDGVNPQGAFDPNTGTVHVISDNVRSGSDIATVIAHETLGHYGLRSVLGDSYGKVMDDIFHGNKEVRDAAAEKVRDGLDQRTATEEVLAEMAEKGANPTGMQRIVTAIRQFFAKMGVPLHGVSDGEVRQLIANARNHVIEGGEVRSGAADTTRSVYKNTPSAPARAKTLEDNIKSLPQSLQRPVRGIMQTIHDVGIKATQSGAFLHDLADWGAKHNLPAMQKIADTMARKGAFKSDRDNLVGGIAKDFEKLTQPEQVKVNKFLHDSTVDQKWGYQPTWRSTVKIDPAAESQWKALGKRGQDQADAMFKHNEDTFNAKQTAIIDAKHALYTELVSAAEAKGESAEHIDALWAELDKATTASKASKLDGPYAPIKRFGDTVITVRSKELIAEKDSKKYNEMARDSAHYQRIDVDGSYEKANRIADLKEQYPDHVVEGSAKETHQYMGAGYEVLNKLAQAAKARIDNAGAEYSQADKDVAHATYRSLQEAITQSLGEHNARTSTMNRKNIGGVNPQEMSRAFFTQAYADNQFLANVKHSTELEQHVSDLRKEVHTGGDRDAKQNFLNQIQARRAAGMNAPMPAWVGHAMRFTSAWKLVTSPAYYLQYLSQPATMFMPLLAGDHGYAKGWGALFQGLRDTKGLSEGSKGVDLSKIKDANERRMLEDLKATGTISIGHDTMYGKTQTLPEKGLSRAWQRGMDLVTSLPHTVELHNRVASALAAYRLDMAKSGDHDAATTYARKSINTAYGDYSSFNAPLITMGGPMTKLMTQYRQFQLIHTAMLVRLGHNAFKGETADVRNAARVQMGVMAGHYGVLAGALGIPAAQTIGNLIRGVFGDDTDVDNETFVKRHVEDKTMQDLILGGLPRAVLGQDLGNRMGAGDILSPFKNVDYGQALGSRKGYKDFATAALGPFIGGMVPQVIDGVNDIQSGDYYRGLAKLMPKGIGDVMKAYKDSTDGVVDRKGMTTTQPDEVTGGDIVAQALGSRPTHLTDPQHDAHVVQTVQQELKDHANVLKSQFVRARKSGDDVNDITEQWQAMQDKQRKVGIKPSPMSELYKAPAQMGKREHMMIDGVPFNKKNRGLVQSVTGENN